MAFLILFLLAFVLSLVLHLTIGRMLVSLSVPVVCFVLFVLFDSYVLPYRGGGASMWPIAIIFGAPVAFLGGVYGVFGARWFKKPGQGGKNAF